MAAAAGCRHDPAREHAPELAVPAASGSAQASSVVVGPCRRIDAHNEAAAKADEDALRKKVDEGTIPPEWMTVRKPMSTPCFANASGTAWAIRLDRFEHGGVIESWWTLLHIGRDGSEVPFLESSQSPFHDVCCFPTAETRAFSLFDLDGDGEPELAFEVASEGPEGGGGVSHVSHHLYTFKDGAVKPYPLPAVLGGRPLRDVDGDGRPDIVIEFDTEDRLSCDGWRWDRVVGPSLVAHGLPGGRFSTNDAVAALHARKACPSRPSVVVARGETPPGATKPLIDDGQTAINVVCARAWGVPSKDIVAALERDCTERGPLGKCEEADERRPGECRNRSTLIGWAEVAPVVLVPDPAAR